MNTQDLLEMTIYTLGMFATGYTLIIRKRINVPLNVNLEGLDEAAKNNARKFVKRAYIFIAAFLFALSTVLLFHKLIHFMK